MQPSKHAANHVVRKTKHYHSHAMPVNRPTEALASDRIDRWIAAKPLREARNRKFDWDAWLAQRHSTKH
jgi:hypothetical protein